MLVGAACTFGAFVASDAGAAKKKKSTKPAANAAPVVQSLRTFSGPNSTRLVVDLSKNATFRVESDSSARRFDLIVTRAMRSPKLDIPDFGDGGIVRVTPEEVSEGVRLRVEVTEWNVPRVFGLESGDEEATATAARIVIDVPRAGQAERDAEERARVDRLAVSGRRIVIVDPGHGGEASGAVGAKKTMEKDVTLAIAKKLAQELERHAGVSVVLTRTSDYDVPLRDRFRIAERYQADAFVSIHTNSSRRRTGRGTEVYFLSLESASDEASKALADIENAADRVSAGPSERVDDELVGILFDLKQTEAIQQSSVLAEAILGEIEGGRKLESRGVKQAPFAVLKSPVVPSVLVETAFINNPTEERLLRDSSFQSEMAAQ
ncbi:MAG: N-acetylmuramoyl-L-alanine amidase family protein, partial [Candidatus Eiseniibacteriota bacterium]